MQCTYGERVLRTSLAQVMLRVSELRGAQQDTRPVEQLCRRGRVKTQQHTHTQNHPGKVFPGCSKCCLFLLGREERGGRGETRPHWRITHRQAHWLDTPLVLYIYRIEKKKPCTSRGRVYFRATRLKCSSVCVNIIRCWRELFDILIIDHADAPQPRRHRLKTIKLGRGRLICCFSFCWNIQRLDHKEKMISKREHDSSSCSLTVNGASIMQRSREEETQRWQGE